MSHINLHDKDVVRNVAHTILDKMLAEVKKAAADHDETNIGDITGMFSSIMEDNVVEIEQLRYNLISVIENELLAK